VEKRRKALPGAGRKQAVNESHKDRAVKAGVVLLAALACTFLFSASSEAQSLRGSRSSLDLQNRIARKHDFTYISTASQVQWFVDRGYLVRVRSGPGVVLKRMSHPYARPEAALLISRLGRQYRSACGENLVVTSLTRPTTRQPSNASPRSVHPTGMAMDLRRSTTRACRSWLERVLLDLEGAGVLEATYERRPPHYHVALFPTQYAAYVERNREATVVAAQQGYRVRRGDSLWSIARNNGTSVPALREANHLRGSRIYPGQLLTIPSAD
jgi:hypothetical protein